MVFNRIKHKIKDKRGASVVYAMLILLVCIVISSVVLAAGTTAAGRVSKAFESDRRYYSVSSAVELLRNMIENQEVSLIWVKESRQHRYYVISLDDDGGSSMSDNADGAAKSIYQFLKGGTLEEIDYEKRTVSEAYDILANAALDLTVGTSRTSSDKNKGIPTGKTFLDTCWDMWENNHDFVFDQSVTTQSFTFSLSSDVNSEELSSVNVEYSLKKDGSMEFIVSSEPTSDGRVYSSHLVFKPVVDDQTIIGVVRDEKDGGLSYESTGGYKQYYYRSQACERRVSYSWSLVSISADDEIISTSSN